MVTPPSASKRDAAHLLVGRRGHFEIAADADAAQLAALLALALALVEALPVGGVQRLLQDRREVAAVVGRAGRGLPGDFALADLVLAAQLDAVEAGLGRGVVDQPLHEVVALGPAGAAIGADEGGVGEHALGRHFHQRRAVEADDVAHDVQRRRLRRHRALEAAEIAEAGEPQREEMAFGVERKLRGHARGRGRGCRRRSSPSARRSTSPGGRASCAACRMQMYSG